MFHCNVRNLPIGPGSLSRRVRATLTARGLDQPLTSISMRRLEARKLAALFLVGIAGAVPAIRAADLDLRPGDRICLVGNTFAERFQLFGYFESELQAAFPDLALSVRNLAWSADEAALRPRPLDFGAVDRHLEAQRADVVLMFYGANESFEGAAGLPAFRSDLGRLLRYLKARTYNGKAPPRVALVSPIPQQALPTGAGLDAAAVSRRNAELRRYSDAAAALAAENGVAFLDIFDAMGAAFAAAPAPLTMNGLHLNEAGYLYAAGALTRALGGTATGTIELSADGGAEVEFKPPVRMRPGEGESATLRVAVADLDAGYYALKRGEETLATGDRAAWAEGVDLPATATAPLAAAGDRLRRAVLRKSRLFFDRYRAVNGYYIYGGRKEPFGVHSFPPEMDRFDERITELDRQIVELAHAGEVWRLVRVDR